MSIMTPAGARTASASGGNAQEESGAAPRKPITLRSLAKAVRRGERFACLTCYDATTARWLERAGVPVLLVGDSAAQVILGYEQSIFAPLDFLIQLTAAVKRGAPSCLVMGDMPFMSYQADDAEAVRHAGRFMTEGLADVVKLEVDGRFTDLVRKLDRAGVPVVAHLGWRPQRARHDGVRTALVAGRTEREVDELVVEAVRMEDAGAVMVLLEQTTAEAAERIVDRCSIPVIGCGAGPACHGQIVVLQDLLGFTDRQPSFAAPVTSMGSALVDAAQQWIGKVARNDLGEHPYQMSRSPTGEE